MRAHRHAAPRFSVTLPRMPQIAHIRHDLFDPGTVMGAVFYGVLALVLASLAAWSIRRFARRVLRQEPGCLN